MRLTHGTAGLQAAPDPALAACAHEPACAPSLEDASQRQAGGPMGREAHPCRAQDASVPTLSQWPHNRGSRGMETNRGLLKP